jgi:hypothetical protein
VLAFVPAMSYARLVFAVNQPHGSTLQLQNNSLTQSIMEFVSHGEKPHPDGS